MQGPSAQSIDNLDVAFTEDWDAFDELTSDAAASPLPSQTTEEMTAIERELDIWNQVIPATKEVEVDILGFWKKQASTLPLLSWLARRIFSIPVSSASSERVFSQGGRVITTNRTLLNTDTAEELIWMHENFDELAPTIKRFVLRMSEYRKMDKENQQQTSQPKSSQSQNPDDPSEPEAEGSDEELSDYIVDIPDDIDDE